MLFHKLSKKEKYNRVKKIWPLYILGIGVFYWKLNFWIASLITVILITITLIQLNLFKQDTTDKI
ncbi:hypothetical protein [Gottfriedia solisilvae]|uniref:Uncharacterized protein n=1 Tax=Gottfriedia solisilvae TaxID=1516104 RepID=A0A8J3APN2_9BACI|nr:hypothetical protein [Gottfriedia solisilvae]GGI17783.1 hypothetical protein GCM10007380_39660 [Gottfriedia solisilvae]